MTTLTESQLASLQQFSNVGDRAGYYSTLAQAGIAYGPLALGVVQESSLSGRMANAFLSYQATQQGISLDRGIARTISEGLMRADLDARISAHGREIGYKEISTYHEFVFRQNGLTRDAWTATVVLDVAEHHYGYLGYSSAEEAKAAVWQNMMQSGYFGGTVGNYNAFALVGQFANPTLEMFDTLNRHPWDSQAAAWVKAINDLIITYPDYLAGDWIAGGPQPYGDRCFPAHTRIQTSLTTSTAISALRVGDVVLAFDDRADKGRGALVPRRVTRLYRNTTTEWIRLRWFDRTAREVITTSGHHFLDEFGQFPTIEEMTRNGSATVVLASGVLTQATAERIIYSAATAHLFERAQVQGMVAGNAALKMVEMDAWQTYNIEVEDLHTYVAEGVRVHNDSGWLGALATAVLSPGNTGVGLQVDIHGNVLTIGEDRRIHDGLVDSLLDGASNFLHGVGTIANAFIDGISDAAQALFGPAGDSNSYENVTRTSWTDTDGHSHWGSLRAFERAKSAGTVAYQNEEGAHSDSAGDSRDGNGASQGTGNFLNDLRDFGRSLGNALGLNPVLLDLNGNGIAVSDLSRSTRFMAGDDGLQHRSAWAGAGDGVLFFDLGNDGKITDRREYVFTDWASGAQDDMAALRAVFDTNGDGKLTSADTGFNGFKVLVTNADGTTTAQTLAQLGITEINLLPDTTKIVLPDGSTITGQSSFVMGGTTRTAANVTLMAEAQGYRTVQSSTLDSTGARVIKTTGYASNGDKAFVMVQTTSSDGLTVSSTYDTDGDGVVDQIQTAVTAINPTTQARTETLTSLRGADATTAVMLSKTITITSADGKSVTVQHDHAGGGWFDQVETRVTNTDGSRLVTITDKAQNGTMIAQSSETISANGLTRVQSISEDGDGDTDVVVAEVISTSAGVRTESVVTRNGSATGTIRSAETAVTSADGLTRTVTEDIGGGDAVEFTTVEVTSVVAGGRQVERTVRNADTSQRLREVTVISTDALTTVTAQEIDDVAGVDRRVTDATMVATDGTRVRTVTQTSGDGSVLGMQRTVLGADQVSAETWEDLNRDGVFTASDLVRSVVVDEATGARTATAWQRSVGDYNSRCGSFRYRSGALESARRAVEPYRSQLLADGRSRF